VGSEPWTNFLDADRPETGTRELVEQRHHRLPDRPASIFKVDVDAEMEDDTLKVDRLHFIVETISESLCSNPLTKHGMLTLGRQVLALYDQLLTPSGGAPAERVPLLDVPL
jgi:hypothetical protein